MRFIQRNIIFFQNERTSNYGGCHQKENIFGEIVDITTF